MYLFTYIDKQIQRTVLRLVTPCVPNPVRKSTWQFASDMISSFCVLQGYAAMQEHLSGQVKNTFFVYSLYLLPYLIYFPVECQFYIYVIFFFCPAMSDRESL